MAVQTTTRGVPEEARNRLAPRAARPSVDEWLRQARARKEAEGIHVPLSAILRARDADRR